MWERFAAHWEGLATDPYAAEKGTRRLRCYGRFLLSRAGGGTPSDHETFAQPENSNPLHMDVDPDRRYGNGRVARRWGYVHAVQHRDNTAPQGPPRAYRHGDGFCRPGDYFVRWKPGSMSSSRRTLAGRHRW
ncbi:2OG-Fe dioxygenase family protein [Streptomyces huasconensis]|uniref:2OG-Fe dioxygenase family protein n=1 Tax=Streptomyces TaxID=1883 RepID=UPI0038B527E8|nr:2OG-Fe dioxygenase family protein [Streptomyces huasconensis]